MIVVILRNGVQLKTLESRNIMRIKKEVSNKDINKLLAVDLNRQILGFGFLELFHL